MRHALIVLLAAVTCSVSVLWRNTDAMTVAAPMDEVRQSPVGTIYTFAEPIDALSIGVPGDTIDLAVSAGRRNQWTAWDVLEIEKEFDPMLRESNLIIFPEPTHVVRIRGSTSGYQVHPIRISKDPARIEYAAVRGNYARPSILSRSQWGADESFTVGAEESARSDVGDQNGTAESVAQDPSKRVQDCIDAKRDHPEEFTTSKLITHNAQGDRYRWPLEYSPAIRKLVVHHTALKVTGDARSPIERVRALYTYHSNSRGWGDIGYHYVIDEKGQIYEGRQGGEYVVGGHVYCGNVGTIGVALMGSFEVEQPSQAQMLSLQWLLSELARRYNLPVRGSTSFHGKESELIVSHGDLVSTECPGYYVRETLSQVRVHVATGNIDTPVSFPVLARRDGRQFYPDSRNRARGIAFAPSVSAPPPLPGEPRLSAVGSRDIVGRPGSEAMFLLQFQAGKSSVPQRSRIAKVTRANERIGLWQDLDGRSTRVRSDVLAPELVSPGESVTIKLRVQFPHEEGRHTLMIGSLTYTLVTEGRRARDTEAQGRFGAANNSSTSTRASVARPSTVVTGSRPPVQARDVEMIRIRLGYEGERATLEMSTGIAAECADMQRFDARGGTIRVHSWNREANIFRGIIECRIIDGKLVLINELPLEDYLAGLAEEPDTEPYEKQRAFAIAARSYAAFYIQPGHTKFPGMPYDGDDSPARFQQYGGVVFEQKNPRWVQAVRSTLGQVLMKDGDIIKAAYFSSSDGRTRSPDEIGWGSYPHAEVFVSKPDMGCSEMRGHGVGMSGCGAKIQATGGKTAEEILRYYYTGAVIGRLTQP